jgi:hypothetical protein
MSAAFRCAAALALAALSSPTPTPPAPDSTDWLIVPGARVGAITAKSTLADVARVYGEANVRLKRVHSGDSDGGVVALVVFPDDSLRRLEIAFGDTVNLRYPKVVTLRGSQSVWHTVGGVTLGTTVDELQKLNAKPFEFNGFGWDYGGQVVNWHGGTMSRDSAIVIRLDALHLFDNKPYQSVMGEKKKVSSANRLARELRPYVGEIDVRLAGS